MMNDDDDIQEYSRPCSNCEYHRQKAQRWREEAYKQAGHPLPEREWVGLTEEERKKIWNVGEKKDQALRALLIQTIRDIEAKLKEKNHG
jgi:hypothetical protein